MIFNFHLASIGFFCEISVRSGFFCRFFWWLNGMCLLHQQVEVQVEKTLEQKNNSTFQKPAKKKSTHKRRAQSNSCRCRPCLSDRWKRAESSLALMRSGLPVWDLFGWTMFCSTKFPTFPACFRLCSSKGLMDSNIIFDIAVIEHRKSTKMTNYYQYFLVLNVFYLGLFSGDFLYFLPWGLSAITSEWEGKKHLKQTSMCLTLTSKC